MSVQKKTKKVLPKEKMIKLYMQQQQHQMDTIASKSLANSRMLMPNITDDELVKHIYNETDNVIIENELQKVCSKVCNSTNSPQSKQTITKKTLKKEEQLKEIQKFCLLNTNNEFKINHRHERIQQQSKDFLNQCRKYLHEKQYEEVLLKLAKINQLIDNKCELIKVINEIYALIYLNNELKLGFNAFIPIELSNNYDLFMQSLQYEKCNEFLQTLEIFMTNKCSLKRLVQSIIATCSTNLHFNNDNDALKQCQYYQQQQIINEIKLKIKSATKNNPLINIECDYLFDQQITNLKPKYETISLVNKDANDSSTETQTETINNTNNNSNKNDGNFEYVDLSKDQSVNDNGTKKCNCLCHQHDTPSNEDCLQAASNHCFECSLKLIKGQLCIKCEGKKAVPLTYRLSQQYKTQNESIT